MPEFKIKNLMIDVISGTQFPDRDKICLWPTIQQCLITKCFKYLSQVPCLPYSKPCAVITPYDPHCGYRSPWCAGCSIISPVVAGCAAGPSVECAGSDLPINCGGSDYVVIDIRKLLENPEIIRSVQEELTLVLDTVAKRGLEISKEMAPQTKEQMDVIEKELTAALEEVRRMRESMR